MKTTLLPQLQTFLVAARRRSFSEAARELGVSPAAVSQSVRQLEEQLRVVLFTRTTRSMALTDAGRRLLEGAGPGLGQALASLRLTEAFRFVVVGAPSYLERQGAPRRPEDLLRHECFTFRIPSSGALYAWELERGRRNWRVPVRGSVVTNDRRLTLALVEQGLGLAYAFEPAVKEELRTGRLVRVLEEYAPTVPGFFLYFPSRAQRSGPLRLFIEVAREFATKAP